MRIDSDSELYFEIRKLYSDRHLRRISSQSFLETFRLVLDGSRLLPLVLCSKSCCSPSFFLSILYWGLLYLLIPEMESSRTSLASRTHFKVLGLGLEASSPQKLPCPRLEDSTIFKPLKFCWKTPETSRKICEDLILFYSSGDCLKKNFWRPFSPEKKLKSFFFRSPEKNFEDFFFFGEQLPCVLSPWPRNFFVSLALASSLVSSTPPLVNTPSYFPGSLSTEPVYSC